MKALHREPPGQETQKPASYASSKGAKKRCSRLKMIGFAAAFGIFQLGVYVMDFELPAFLDPSFAWSTVQIKLVTVTTTTIMTGKAISNSSAPYDNTSTSVATQFMEEFQALEAQEEAADERNTTSNLNDTRSPNKLSRAEKYKKQRQKKAHKAAAIPTTSGNYTHTKQQFAHEFKLKVPFYVYSGVDLLDWSEATVKCHKGHYDSLYKYWFRKGSEPLWKHMDDYWFHQAAMIHPMRTDNPADAKLFFVPTMMNAFGTSAHTSCKFCLPDKKDDKGQPLCKENLLRATSAALEQSPWFQRYQGKDHFLIDSHWRGNYKGNLTNEASALFHCNRITFEAGKLRSSDENRLHKEIGRISFQSMYVGHPCPDPISEYSKKTYDFTFVGSLGSKQRKAFNSRKRLCKWVHQNQKSPSPRYTFSNCGSGEQCPNLPLSKYGFHIRGDTLGANRLMDILMSRTVPIFTDKGQYPILPDFVPWRDLGFFLAIGDKKDEFEEGLLDILKLDPEEYQKKQDLIDKYYHIFDHRQPYQFDAYMNRLAETIGLYNATSS